MPVHEFDELYYYGPMVMVRERADNRTKLPNEEGDDQEQYSKDINVGKHMQECYACIINRCKHGEMEIQAVALADTCRFALLNQ